MLKINVTKWVKGRFNSIDALAESNRKLFNTASHSNVLVRAGRLEQFKAEHLARMARRFKQFYDIMAQENIYLDDALIIIFLIIGELVDDCIHPYDIMADIERIENFMSYDPVGRMISASDDIPAV